MTRLTKIEKETIVLFNEGEDKANIYTHNAGLKKRLAAQRHFSRHWHIQKFWLLECHWLF